mmetsp:Transcript_115217/g.332833  ORF Transcript_115217/g.332833 Transcript_115217/m.332833 type:complete len:219 (+) Transcript_115217:56-712(+)
MSAPCRPNRLSRVRPTLHHHIMGLYLTMSVLVLSIFFFLGGSSSAVFDIFGFFGTFLDSDESAECNLSFLVFDFVKVGVRTACASSSSATVLEVFAVTALVTNAWELAGDPISAQEPVSLPFRAFSLLTACVGGVLSAWPVLLTGPAAERNTTWSDTPVAFMSPCSSPTSAGHKSSHLAGPMYSTTPAATNDNADATLIMMPKTWPSPVKVFRIEPER